MPPRSKKWENFKKANTSNLNVENPNTGEANLQKDWFRAASYEDYPININGVPLKEIADKFNKFEKEENVLDFFEKVILKDFKGDAEQKEEAIDYLKKTFHQGGLLYPVTSALATELKDKNGDRMCTLSDHYRYSEVNIVTTNNGFKVQEYSEANALLPLSEKVMKYAPEGKIYPQSGKENIIKAEATIAIDFSKDSRKPSLTVESNHMEILHEGLKNHLDNRNLGQKIVDFFKDIFGLNKVKDISPSVPDKSFEELKSADNDGENQSSLLR
jgi:hypothetical protein